MQLPWALVAQLGRAIIREVHSINATNIASDKAVFQIDHAQAYGAFNYVRGLAEVASDTSMHYNIGCACAMTQKHLFKSKQRLCCMYVFVNLWSVTTTILNRQACSRFSGPQGRSLFMCIVDWERLLISSVLDAKFWTQATHSCLQHAIRLVSREWLSIRSGYYFKSM